MPVTPAPIDPPVIERVLWGGLEPFASRLAYDVGGNVGQSLRHIVDLGYREVVSLEPAVECREQLIAECVAVHQRTGAECAPLFLAASSTTGVVELAACVGKIDTGQLVTVRWDEWGTVAERRTLACTTLDDLAAKDRTPGLIKIDVEGHELEVLLGSRRLLRGELGERPRLLVEVHSTGLGVACQALLAEVGYESVVVRHPHYPPGHEYYNWHYWLRAHPR